MIIATAQTVPPPANQFWPHTWTHRSANHPRCIIHRLMFAASQRRVTLSVICFQNNGNPSSPITTINSEIPRSLPTSGGSVSCFDPNPSGLPMAAFRGVLSRRFASLLRACAGDGGAGGVSVLGRYPFLQKRPLFQPALRPYGPPTILQDERIAERIRGLNPCRISLDVILPPAPTPELKEEKMERESVSLEEAKKVIRASQVASVRARLLTAGESCISYSDFVRICCEATNSEQGLKIARSLDESGLVLVFGNVVFLKPEEQGLKRRD